MVNMIDLTCTNCEEQQVDVRRWQLGYHYCKDCGEYNAIKQRQSWCVIQEYTKGNYQLVTPTQALTTLKQTNPKENRL